MRVHHLPYRCRVKQLIYRGDSLRKAVVLKAVVLFTCHVIIGTHRTWAVVHYGIAVGVS